MSLELISIFGMPLIAFLGWLMRTTILERINKLEETIEKTIPEVEVKLLIDEKIDPIKENVMDMKTKIDQIYKFLLFRKD